jgi:hypothetical protein
VFQRSASTPVACSTRTRLVSAVSSWLFSTCDCSSVRCWRIAMVATSASGWASAMSSAGSGRVSSMFVRAAPVR